MCADPPVRTWERVNPPWRTLKNRGITRKTRVYPGELLLSHVQPPPPARPTHALPAPTSGPDDFHSRAQPPGSRSSRRPALGRDKRSPRARSEAPGGADPVENGVTPRLHHDTGRTARHAQDTQDNHRLRRNSAQRPPDHRLANASDRSRRGNHFLGISQVERGGFPGLAGYIVIAAGRGGP